MSLKLFEKLPVEPSRNVAPFDRFTIAHVAIGVILGLNKMTPLGITTFAVGWEIVEQPLKRKFSGMFPVSSPDSLPNMTVDALSVIAGWGLIRLYDKYKK